jgi:hypothetical protein
MSPAASTGPFQALSRIEEAPNTVGAGGTALAMRVGGSGLGDALRRHWLLAPLPLIVLVGVALADALTRTPTYTPECRLVMGGLDLSQPGALSGYANATQGLASTYSRAITANAVAAPLSRWLGENRFVPAERLRTTPLPARPVFRVIAEGDSSEDSVRLATAAGRSLISTRPS